MEITVNNIGQFRFISSTCPQSQQDIDVFLTRPEPTFLDKFFNAFAPQDIQQGALRTASMDALNYLMFANGNCILIIGEINNDGVVRILCIKEGLVHVVQEPNFVPERVEFASVRLWSYPIGGGSAIGPALSSSLVGPSSTSSSSSLPGGLFGQPPSTSSSSGGLFGQPPSSSTSFSGGLFGQPPSSSTSSSGGLFGPLRKSVDGRLRKTIQPRRGATMVSGGGGGGGGTDATSTGGLPQTIAVNTDCSICTEDFSADDREISQINCEHGPHAYHSQCLLRMRASGARNRCPICRDYFSRIRAVRRRPAAAAAAPATPAAHTSSSSSSSSAAAAGGGGGALPQSGAVNTDCAICTEDFSADDREISQINCEHGPHAYHTQCLQRMQASGGRRTCPVCRDPFTTRRAVRRRAAAAAGGGGGGGGGEGAAPSQQQRKIQQLMRMGVSRQVARQALQAAGGDVNIAGNLLLLQ